MKLPNLIWSSCVITNEDGSTQRLGHCWAEMREDRSLRIAEDDPDEHTEAALSLKRSEAQEVAKRAARHGGSPHPYSRARRDAVETLRHAGWHRWAERVVSGDDFGLDVLANALALCATRDTNPPELRDRAKDAMVAVMVLDALVKSHPSGEDPPW